MRLREAWVLGDSVIGTTASSPARRVAFHLDQLARVESQEAKPGRAAGLSVMAVGLIVGLVVVVVAVMGEILGQ